MRKPHLSLAIGILFLTSSSSHASAAGLLLVANKGDRTLGLVDPDAGTQIATVAEDGVTGHEVAASLDGKRAFVPIYGNAGVGRPGTDGSLMRVIDLATRQIVGTVDFGKGVRPHCAVIGPKNGLVYVTTELENSVTVVDPTGIAFARSQNQRFLLSFRIFIDIIIDESHMLAITHDGLRGYTANVAPGTVSVLDLEAKKVLAIIPICKTTQRISLSVDDHWVFTADQDTPRLAVVDTTRNVVDRWVALPGTGYGSSVTPDGRWLVIAVPARNQVAVVDLRTMEVAHTLDVPRVPQETLVRPDGAEAYVSCDASAKVAVIETKEWSVRKLIDAGKTADGLAWAPGKSN